MKKFFLMHPLFLAIFPIVFIYSYNVQEASINQTFIPILISLSFTMLLWIILSLCLKDKLKASIITTVFVMLFFTYGHVFDAMDKFDFFFVKHRYMLPSTLFLGGYFAYFINTTKNRLRLEAISKTLTIVAIILVFINLFNIVPYEIRKAKFKGNYETTKADISTSYPDIYYIILDEYASLSTISNIYGYDNSQFASNLKNKGFYIANKSNSRYTASPVSMASALNMEHRDKYDLLSAHQAISNNKVANYLKQKGYKYIYIGNRYEIGRYNPNADYHFNYFLNNNVSIVDEFVLILIESTMLKPISYYFEMSNNDIDNLRNPVLYSLYKLKNMPEIEGPKFVFAHILCPHEPFVFNKDGAEVDSINHDNWKDKQYYLNQYIYITKQVDLLVNELLNKSNKTPIIIIQSDHGPRAATEPGFMPDEEMNKIFNAYLLPGVDNKILYDSISPVNSFRVIFDLYFEEKFDLLED